MNRRNALQLTFASTASAAVAYTGALWSQATGTPNTSQRVAEGPTPQQIEADKAKAQILMLIYPRFTALDLIGPQHVFALLGGEYKTRLVWKTKEPVMSDTGVPTYPTQTFEETTEAPLILFIPGGTDGTLAAMEDPEVREFVKSRGAKATYVTSVCTGSLILAATGLLRGYQATTHWLALDTLKAFGATPVAKRVVIDRNRITGAGVTAGIDFALTVIAKLKDESYAKGVQLMMEYDPEPPFGSIRPDTADPETVKLLKAMTVQFKRDVEAVADKVAK